MPDAIEISEHVHGSCPFDTSGAAERSKYAEEILASLRYGSLGGCPHGLRATGKRLPAQPLISDRQLFLGEAGNFGFRLGGQIEHQLFKKQSFVGWIGAKREIGLGDHADGLHQLSL